MKILVLTGAGASIEYLTSASGQALSTNTISGWVKNDIVRFVEEFYPHESDTERVQIQSEIARAQASLHRFDENYNFEALVHLLDEITDVYVDDSIRHTMANPQGLRNSLFPLIDFFSGVIPPHSHATIRELPHYLRCFILENIVHSHTPRPIPFQSEWKNFYQSIVEKGHTLTVADLNYDDLQFSTCNAMNGNLDWDSKLKNGFEHTPPPDGFNTFSYSNFRSARNVIMHLHGSIHLYSSTMGLRFGLKLDEIARHRRNFHPSLPKRGQSGAYLHSQYMVAGFNKFESVSQSVFSTYYLRLLQTIDSADLIVIIGYGGGDIHLNMALSLEQNASKKYVIVSHGNHRYEPFSTYLSRPTWRYLFSMTPPGDLDPKAWMKDSFRSHANCALTFRGARYFLNSFQNVLDLIGVSL